MSFSVDSQIALLQQLIDSSRYTVVISGAGISVSTGIPDMLHLNMAETFQFMSTAILKFAPNHYYRIARKLFLNYLFDHGSSLAHRKLAELERKGKIQGVITTNLDNMHSLAGSKNVAEIQGSFGINKCLKCEKRHDDVQIWNQGIAPKCECGGVMCCFPVYSHVGVFSEDIPKARNWVSKAKLVLVIGAKGNYGGVYWDYLNSNATIVQINLEQTQFDSIAKLNIRKGADEVFEKIV